MTNVIIALLTVALVLDCLLLALFILMQLPKKEAGVGMAFGGGAADALFGAGSGNALSNMTKYTATAFFVLVFSLSILNTHARHSGVSQFKDALARQPAPVQTTPSATAKPAVNATANSNLPITTLSSPIVPAAPVVPASTNSATSNK